MKIMEPFCTGENIRPDMFKCDSSVIVITDESFQKFLSQGPTLVVHDGSGDVDIILKSLAPLPLHPFLVVETKGIPEEDNQKNRRSRTPELHPTNDQQTPKSTVIIVRSPDPLLDSLRRWSIWSAHSRVVLVLQPGANVRGWIDAFWRKTKAVDVIAMVVTEPPQFYTWFPYQKDECTNVMTITKLNRTALYPPKIGQYLNNCSFVAVTSHLSLLVNDDFDGIETRLFHDMAKKLGLNGTYVRLPEGLFVWTTVDQQGEPASGLKLMWENIAEVMFSNVGRTYYNDPFADFLPSHLTDHYVWFVPEPKPVSRATAIFLAFKPEAWAWVLASTLGIFAIFTLIPLIEKGSYRSAILATLAIALNLPCSLLHSRTFRWFSMVAYLYSIHITTAYQSSLIVLLSNVPREKPIVTWEDLAETNLMIELHESHREFLGPMSTNPVIAALCHPDRSKYLPTLNLEGLARNRDFAMLGPKLSFGHYLETGPFYDQLGYPYVRILKDVVEKARFNFFLSKGHPLSPKLHNYMQRLIDGGMPKHYHDAQKKPPRPLLRELVAFGFDNVEGPFILYLFMIGVSFVIWLLELSIYALTKPKTSFINSKEASKALVRQSKDILCERDKIASRLKMLSIPKRVANVKRSRKENHWFSNP